MNGFKVMCWVAGIVTADVTAISTVNYALPREMSWLGGPITTAAVMGLLVVLAKWGHDVPSSNRDRDRDKENA